MNKNPIIYFLFLILLSCNYLNQEAKEGAIARVNDVYLYKEELNNLVPNGASEQDSISIVRKYLDRWASQKLLINAAELNLDEDTKASFDELIAQYKIDLYTKAYIEELVKRAVDTIVTPLELKNYYNENKEKFKTNGVLVRLRYINLPKENPKYETIKSKFFDYKKSDTKFWNVYSLQCNSFAFNDSIWVEMNQVYSKLPFINQDNWNQYISPGSTIQHLDSLDMYLVKVKDVIQKNQIGPFEYLKPILKEVILNKRKIELIKNFEKQITDDAIKDKKYEIYK